MFSHVKIKDVLYSNECNTVHQNVLNVKSSYYETKATYDLTQHSPLFNNNVFAGPPRHPTETALCESSIFLLQILLYLVLSNFV